MFILKLNGSCSSLASVFSESKRKSVHRLSHTQRRARDLLVSHKCDVSWQGTRERQHWIQRFFPFSLEEVKLVRIKFSLSKYKETYIIPIIL